MLLNFQVQGTGFPILILHGLFGSLDNWRTISRRLSDHFHVFTLDLRNHGRSPHSDAMSYDVMADDVAEFLQTHNLQRAHILGHSLGGKVAMHFALSYPNRVARLIVADIAPRAYSPSHLAILDAMRSLNLASFANRNDIDRALAQAIPQSALRHFLLKNVTRTDSGAFAWKLNLPAIRQNHSALLGAIDGAHPFPGAVLFIRGGKSDYVQNADHESILRLFPQAAFETIPNAGHWLHTDAPEGFVESVIEFLTR
jgi:pimeloyl-ACP methyl ester carboxylesterase